MKPISERRLHTALHLGGASAFTALLNQPLPDSALLILGGGLLAALAWTLAPLWPAARGQEVPFSAAAREIREAALSMAALGAVSGAAHLGWGLGGQEMPGMIQLLALICAGSGVLALPISLWRLRR